MGSDPPANGDYVEVTARLRWKVSSNMNLKNWLSTIGASAILGGIAGVEPMVAGHQAFSWPGFAALFVAGMAATIAHLYQTPGKTSVKAETVLTGGTNGDKR